MSFSDTNTPEEARPWGEVIERKEFLYPPANTEIETNQNEVISQIIARAERLAGSGITAVVISSISGDGDKRRLVIELGLLLHPVLQE